MVMAGVSKFDNHSIEIIQYDKKRKNIKRKINRPLRNPREDVKKSNIDIMTEQREQKKNVKEIMGKNSTNVVRDINLPITDTQ